MDKLQKWLLGIGLAVVAVLLIGVYSSEKECEAKGGKRLRGVLLEPFKCYDAASLKVLP